MLQDPSGTQKGAVSHAEGSHASEEEGWVLNEEDNIDKESILQQERHVQK